MRRLWNRLFGGGGGGEWERDEEPRGVAREVGFEHESVDNRANAGFVEEHLGLPPEHGRPDDDFPRD